MVDFQKGERLVVYNPSLFRYLLSLSQRNMDYSICNAVSYNAGEGRDQLDSLLIYDIGCHWQTKFFERLAQNPTLDFNSTISLIVAVGKFHLGAHVNDCFFKYTLNFIEGAGQIDGEIMETLWSLFNKFAKMARSMGTAHRQEILNDHMRDVNWKKTVGMGLYPPFPFPQRMKFAKMSIYLADMLMSKYHKAKKGYKEMNDAFIQLSGPVSEENRRQWTKDAEKANFERGDSLKIYQLNITKGKNSLSCSECIDRLFYSSNKKFS